MELVIDSDVKNVAEFMQSSIAAGRLFAVAKGLSELAPLLWGTYGDERLQTLRLAEPTILGRVPHIRSVASESSPVLESADDDSAEGTS